MERKASVAPFVDGTIPTTLDKKLAPEGTHVFSMFSAVGARRLEHRAPPRRARRLRDSGSSTATTSSRRTSRDSIIDYQVIGPYDMEQDLGLIGGNIFHGELSVDQLFHMRPAPGYADYRTPLRGLYHGSSATHAGGGVNGIPGWQAFRMAKKDKALGKK